MYGYLTQWLGLYQAAHRRSFKDTIDPRGRKNLATPVFNSYGLLLSAHQPFESFQKAIEGEQDIHSETSILEQNSRRIRVCDTDNGRTIQRRIDDLKELLQAYRSGLMKES